MELAEDECDNVECQEEEIGIERVRTEDDCERLTDDIVCLSFLQQLKQLARSNFTQCSVCNSKVQEIVESFVGSALYLKWVRQWLKFLFISPKSLRLSR